MSYTDYEFGSHDPDALNAYLRDSARRGLRSTFFGPLPPGIDPSIPGIVHINYGAELDGYIAGLKAALADPGLRHESMYWALKARRPELSAARQAFFEGVYAATCLSEEDIRQQINSLKQQNGAAPASAKQDFLPPEDLKALNELARGIAAAAQEDPDDFITPEDVQHLDEFCRDLAARGGEVITIGDVPGFDPRIPAERLNFEDLDKPTPAGNELLRDFLRKRAEEQDKAKRRAKNKAASKARQRNRRKR
jgi:hypothetical protein